LGIAPNYVPWWNDLLTLSPQDEIVLFAVQGLIGLGIIIFAFRYYRKSREVSDAGDR